MADDTRTEGQSGAEQQTDPNADLMKARPGGETDIGHVPNPSRDEKSGQ